MADMHWLLNVPTSGGTVGALEQELDAVAAWTGATITIMCACRRESFAARDMAGVMCVHPHQPGASPEDLGFRIWSSGEGRWHVSGQVDLRAAEAFPAALRTAAQGCGSMCLDCSQLQFIDIAGIRTLAEVAYGSPIHMRLRGADESLHRYWQLLEYDRVVTNVEFCA
jgi:anti-anti-sigma factor